MEVSYQGVKNEHFCEKGVKISTNVHPDIVFYLVVNFLRNVIFMIIPWTFHLESAPGHKARNSQGWLTLEFRTVIALKIGPQLAQT